jgi:SAM-dependent methyltransferase
MLFDNKRWFQPMWGDGEPRGKLLLDFLTELGYNVADKLILDIGCGVGGVSLVMAKNSRHTVSMDISKEMLLLTRKRIKERSSTVLASGHSLPFNDGCADVVLLFGVFEFIPASKPLEDPEQTHLETLQDIRRVLTPYGVLVLGIENRRWLQYWFGMKDFHSGLRFVTVLPRRIADFVSRLIRNRRYLERLYTYDELNRLLEKGGFRVCERYTALPGWFYMDRMSRFDAREFNQKLDSIRPWSPFIYGIEYNLNCLPKIFWKALNSIGALKLFCSNFIFVCNPQPFSLLGVKRKLGQVACH